MNQLICPVCQQELRQTEHTYCCSKHHSFDRAKSGYVNLLLSNGKHAKIPGDNKQMVTARKNFLEKNFYAPLADALCQEAALRAAPECCILDAGCGEGYYTNRLWQALESLHPHIVGIDISKFALNFAARKNSNIIYAAASVFHLPIASQSCHMAFNLFAPYCGEELQRVLIPDGFLFLVIPGENHLWELKQAIYDEPYHNQVKDYFLEGFILEKKKEICDTIYLTSQEDIQNLFSMTPYYYRTSEENQKRLSSLSSLATQIQFQLLIYRRKKD